MPFEVDTSAAEQWATQANALDALTESARVTGVNGANEVRAGRPVERYGTTWDEVQSRLQDRFPDSGINPNQARAVFEHVRDATFQSQLLAPPKPGEGERDELANYMQHIPVARHLWNIQQAGQQMQVRNLIEAGQASQEDYADYQRRLRNERYQGDRSNVQAGLEGIAQIPAFGGEMALAGPFAAAGASAVGMPLGSAATASLAAATRPTVGLIARAALENAPGWLAGETVRAAAMPANAASSIFQRINPHVGEADATAADVFRGYLDHQIEVASESLGGPISSGLGALVRGTGSIASRLPGATRAAAVANALTHAYTQSIGTPAFQRKLQAIGFNGLLGEFLEERAGEVARGLTGVEPDYGMTGNFFAGATGDRRSFMAGVDQLVQEGITLGGFSMIAGMLGTASTRLAVRQLRAQGLTQAQAEAQISQTTLETLRNPEIVSRTPQGPLREVAQMVAQTIDHLPSQGPSPGLEGIPAPAAASQTTSQTAPEADPTPQEGESAPSAAPGVPGTSQGQETAPQGLIADDPVATPTQAAPENLASPSATPTKEQIAQVGKAVGLNAKKSQELFDRGEPWMVQAVASAATPPSITPALPPHEQLANEYRRAALSPREISVVNKFLAGKDYDEIGKSMGLTKQRAQQIAEKATRDLGPKSSLYSILTGNPKRQITPSLPKKAAALFREAIATDVAQAAAGYREAAWPHIESAIEKHFPKDKEKARALAEEMIVEAKAPLRKREKVEGAAFTADEKKSVAYRKSDAIETKLNRLTEAMIRLTEAGDLSAEQKPGLQRAYEAIQKEIVDVAEEYAKSGWTIKRFEQDLLAGASSGEVAQRNVPSGAQRGPATPVPQRNRQNAQQTSPGPQTSGLPQNGGAGVPLVQPSAVPGVAKASAAGPVEPPLTNKQRFAVERSKPAAGEYLAANFARENLQAKTLFNAIVAQGGLNEANVRSYGLDLKTLKESFPSRLFVKKGGVNIEDLVGGSEIGRQIWGTRAESETDKQHRGDELMEKLANHYLLEPGKWYEHEQYKKEIQEYRDAVTEKLRGQGLEGQRLEAATNAEIASHLAADNREAEKAVGESPDVGDAFEGDATSPAREQSANRPQSDADLAFHLGRGQSAESSARPITVRDVKAVSDLSPHHAALVNKLGSMVRTANLPLEKKMQYLRTQFGILSRMTPEFAELHNKGLREAKFFGSTRELTMSIADSPAVREALAQGNVAGGSYNLGTGVMRLDGGTTGNSAARIAGHESAHSAEGRERAVARSPGFQNAWDKEIKGGAIGDYAATNVDEGLAEVMGLLLSGEMSPEALHQRFPLIAAELEGHGWIPEGGKGRFEKKADVFDKPINDGPLHADTLLHVGHDVADDFKKVMAPGTRGEFAKVTGNALRHSLAEIDHIDKVQEKATREAKDFFDKEIVNAPSAAERQTRLAQATDAVETGKIANMPAGMRSETEEAMAQLAGISKKDEADLIKRDMLQTFVEHYFPHVWEKPGATPSDIGQILARRPLEGSKAFMRERVVPTIRDGLDMGLTPKSWNPVELVLLKSREVRKAIMAHDLFQELLDNGVAKFVKIGHPAPEGWRKVDDKMMRVLMKSHVGLVQTGEYWMPEQAARVLNNYLSPGLSGNSATYDILREYSEMVNGAQLGFGVFHTFFVLMDTQASATSLALQKLSRGDFKGAAGKMIEGLIPGVAAFTRAKEGVSFWKEYYSPGTGTQEIQAIVQTAKEGGFHLQMNKMIRGDALSKFRNAISEAKLGQKTAYASILRHSLPALSQALSIPTMEYMVPIMKAGVLMDLIRHVQEKLPSGSSVAERRAAYAKVVDSVDNRLGELAYDNLHWNRTFKDSLMVGLRSVGWNTGTWREVGGGVVDVPSSVKGIRSGEGISPRTAYIGGLVMTAAVYGAMYQVLMGAGWPEEPKDYFFPKTGRRRRDGRLERVSLPSYMRDIAHVANRADEGPLRIASNVWHMGRGKINPGINSVIEMLNNENFFGQAIYDPRDPFWRQGTDLFKHVAGGLEPFSIRNLHPAARQLPPDAAIMAQGFFGITPSPSYIVNSWQQQRAIEAGQSRTLTPLERLRRSRVQSR